MKSKDGPVVIVGAGIVGCSTAYYLALQGVKCTLVDEVGIAAAASGKAGGFLARDWSTGTPLESLARQGFQLHEHLSQSFPEACYRRVRAHEILLQNQG
jgi:glycine/D-amino acid oxidase-like deaminating enzyme